MFALFVTSALALAEPQGHYAGSTRVTFKKISVEMATVSSSGPGKGTFSLKVTGIPGGHVDCPTEEYLIEDNDLQMPNMETEGDCAHDQFKSSSLTLKSATYDPVKDTITMKAKWKAISVTIVAKKVADDFAYFDASAAMSEFLEEVSAPALAEPKGHYVGKTRVAFKAIHVEMETVTSTGPGAGTFSLKVTGIPGGHVDCPTEEYHIEGNDLQMPNMETEGDCAHDQFKSSSLTLISATYDPAGDAITMKAKWKAISVTIVAKKVADEFDFGAFVAMTEFLEEEVSAPALAEPKGHYEGSTRVALKKIRVIMETVSSSGPGKGTFSLQVKGIPGGHVDCPTEEYLVEDNDLQMPNMETEGDCAHDQFKSSSLTLTSATYDPDTDAITMKAKWKKINVTIVAKKTAAFDFEESTGSLERLQRLQLAN